MPINTLEYAKIFQTELDKQVAANATSGWMEANAGQVKYSGGREIKIPKMSLNGLGDYDRDDGYAQGSVTLEFQTKEMTQDRGRKFQLDAMDVDETNFVTTATSVMGEFQRLKVIPEIDAYRYSSIISGATTKSRVTASYTPDVDTIMQKLLADIAEVEDIAGETQLVITMNSRVASLLGQSKEFVRNVSSDTFKAGEFNQKVRFLDNNPILRAPSGLMKSAYLFKDGTTAEQTDGGFSAAEGALQANWIICARRVPIAISKTDVMRIFDPMTNQKANAWQMDYRKYHDLFIMDNAYDLVWVNTQPVA